MLNTYQDMFSSHYYEVPSEYTLKMKINHLDSNANMKKFAPPPKFGDVRKAAALFGFNIEVWFIQKRTNKWYQNH